MKLSCSFLILAIAFSLLPSQPLVAQVSPHPPSAAAKDAFIRQIMEDAGIPGLQAVVVKRDKVVWSNSYGDAVLDAPGPRRAMNEHDLILTASTTKLCVTIAALQQLEKGKLALDDDINRSLPFLVRNPNWPDVPITWRMLLTHTSSIDHTTDALIRALCYWGKDHPLAFDDYVKARFLPVGKYHAYELFRSGKPGSERIYSNDGFSLLAFALEQVTHESFDAYVRREIWTPLKMNETSYSLAGLSPDHLAVGYGAERKADGTFSFVPAKVFWGHESASGSITDHQNSYPDYPVGRTYTNAREFARLILMFLNGGTVDGARILSPSSVDMIFTPSGYRNLDGWKQGIGVNGLLDLRGRQVWGHDGQGEGSVSALYVNRETGVGVFTIANSNYLDASQNYSLVDLDMHLIAWFEDSAIDRVAANYIPALEKGNQHAPFAAAAREPDQSTKSNRRTAQRLSSQEKNVWKGEQDSFRYLNAKDLKAYMSMWDANFVGWPDYNDRPVRKSDIESSADGLTRKTIEPFDQMLWVNSPWNSGVGSTLLTPDVALGSKSKASMEFQAKFSGNGFESVLINPPSPLASPSIPDPNGPPTRPMPAAGCVCALPVHLMRKFVKASPCWPRSATGNSACRNEAPISRSAAGREAPGIAGLTAIL